MKHSRLISLILCTLLLLPALIACGDSGTPASTTASGAAQTTASATEAITEDPDKDDLPEGLAFEGETVDMIIRTYNTRYSREFLSEGETGDVVQDEVYKRQLRVEDRLKIKINIIEDIYSPSNKAHGPWNAIADQITSGDAEYELVAGSNFNAQPNMTKGLYHNLLNIKSFNFDKPYWAKEVMDGMRIGDSLFTCTGDISTYLWESLYVMFFNRDLCESFQMKPADIYNTVRGGEWTIDRMLEMTKDVYSDENHDGIKSDGDTYGLGLLVSSGTDGFFSSCDIRIVDEKDGELQIVLDLEKLSNVVEKLNTACWNTLGVQPVTELDSNATPTRPKLDRQFADGQLCFMTQILYFLSTENMRSMSSDYGIIPYPKYSKDQVNYQTFVHDQFTAIAIPVSVSPDRVEMVASVLEAMSSDGRKNVKPLYYGVALTGKYAKDPDSVQMLDTIFSHITMDRGLIFANQLKGSSSSLCQEVLRNQILNNSVTLASTFQVSVKAGKKNLEKIAQAFEDNKDK